MFYFLQKFKIKNLQNEELNKKKIKKQKKFVQSADFFLYRVRGKRFLEKSITLKNNDDENRIKFSLKSTLKIKYYSIKCN